MPGPNDPVHLGLVHRGPAPFRVPAILESVNTGLLTSSRAKVDPSCGAHVPSWNWLRREDRQCSSQLQDPKRIPLERAS